MANITQSRANQTLDLLWTAIILPSLEKHDLLLHRELSRRGLTMSILISVIFKKIRRSKLPRRGGSSAGLPSRTKRVGDGKWAGGYFSYGFVNKQNTDFKLRENSLATVPHCWWPREMYGRQAPSASRFFAKNRIFGVNRCRVAGSISSSNKGYRTSAGSVICPMVDADRNAALLSESDGLARIAGQTIKRETLARSCRMRRDLLQSLLGHLELLAEKHPKKAASPVARQARKFVKGSLRRSR